MKITCFGKVLIALLVAISTFAIIYIIVVFIEWDWYWMGDISRISELSPQERVSLLIAIFMKAGLDFFISKAYFSKKRK